MISMAYYSLITSLGCLVIFVRYIKFDLGGYKLNISSFLMNILRVVYNRDHTFRPHFNGPLYLDARLMLRSGMVEFGIVI